ncbi:DUF6090 family protein [Allomuricauda sp. NBRC 101325]|uniref:DUF6090 family protein n=1 Tax=Allomuricauda sp. NBRC 101325 TaxID=1113758 RepID=UPI0024A43EAC|nr:DUF6090 family protein [Muricauda sp. NBRC 101325]GLU44435.1 hypothetical protein Musp01_20590 [Muricauda sp. NBRC 101325]
MIRFFRNIRKQLFSENKFSKYLLYALGEIILVVVGILIALQLNNWSQQKQDRHREQLILKQLNSEFQNNKQLFELGRSTYQTKLEACNKVISFFPLPEEQKADSIVKYFQGIFQSYMYNPSNGLVESLLYSSSIEVIQNDSLKHLLTSWKDVVTDYQEEESIVVNELRSLEKFIQEEMDFTQMTRTGIKGEKNFKTLNTIQFQNAIIKIQFSTAQLLQAMEEEDIDQHLQSIIRQSEQELTHN